MVDDIQDVVAENAPETTERLAEFSDEYLRGVALRAGAIGTVIGVAIGSAATYFFVNRRAQAKADERLEVEIEEMREHYRAKGIALEAQAGKGDLAELVKNKGYAEETSPKETSLSSPMAVQPPASVVEAEDAKAGEPPDDSAMAEDDVEGANGVKSQPVERNIFRDQEVASDFEWDDHLERRRRSPDRPYVIHRNEVQDMQGYSEVSYTYYAADDVLCNERDEVIDPAGRDDLVGEANLERFGHGSEDPMVVFIRNDNLEIIAEIVKSPNSFAQEVHGFDPPERELRHDSGSGYNVQRMRRRERDHGEEG